jgi:hypothetical protein
LSSRRSSRHAIPWRWPEARSGGAGPHAKPHANERQAAKRLLAKLTQKLDPDPDA